MATEYTTLCDDVLDVICFRHYGVEHGTTERVLEYNRHLADYGPVLPAGVVITLPELIKSDPVQEQVQLWD